MKSILFNTDMVRAILEGRKTVTRRAMKPQPEKSADSPYECIGGRFAFRIGEYACTDQYKPPYRPGDILYVRETWAHPSGIEIKNGADPQMYLYKADVFQPAAWDKWRPSIHMPREAARIFLRMTCVRLKRLQKIDDAQAYAEGAEGIPCNCDGSEVFCSRCCNTGWLISPRSEFAHIWDSTIKPDDRVLYGWEANPWVWVIEFKRITKEEAE